MKTAIVTGASRGIGRAVMKKLISENYTVIGTCINNPHLLCDCIPFTGNAGDPEVCRRLAAFAKEKLGHVDVLVNNAGICVSGLVQDIDDKTFRSIMDTNFTSVFAMCREIVPMMLSQGSGSILNVSSVWGETGAACDSVYSASKGAINAFTKSLADELSASNIKVNAIMPGAVDTDMNRCYSEEEIKALEAEIPFGRMYTPEEVAEEIYGIIISGETGVIKKFDGGWT